MIFDMTKRSGGGAYTDEDFITRYFSTDDFETITTEGVGKFRFGGGFAARSLRMLNVAGGGAYTAQFFLLNNTVVQYIIMPKLSDVSVDMFKSSTGLKAFDNASAAYIRATAFSGCTRLNMMVLRRNSVTALVNINAFSSTPFASGGTGGTLYVPNDLIASYQAATNWSTILGYTNNQIKSIESTHTDPNAPIDLSLYYADGTPIPTT